MILKETILSAFTDRGTLLQWLKKVESALNADVLTDISVEQIDETHVKMKFTFENGVFVESPVLTLARGKDGEAASVRVGTVTTGAAGTNASVTNVGTESDAVLNFVIPRGRDGLNGEGVAATVEVGTVTTGAPGTNASVTNVGTPERAILNFVIPRGDKGATGEAGDEGSAGVGFEDADGISINDGSIDITADENGVNIGSTFEVAVGDEILEIPSTMYLPVKGSESIVIDVNESGDFIDVHLDAAILSKINRAVLTPISSLDSFALLGVGSDNLQRFVKLGSGLSYDEEYGVLTATSTGGGGVEIDTSLIFNCRIPGGLYSNSIAFNCFLDNNPKYYPVYTSGQFNVVKCSALIINDLGAPNITVNGSLVLADGTAVTSTNITSHYGKLMILKSDVTITGRFE